MAKLYMEGSSDEQESSDKYRSRALMILGGGLLLCLTIDLFDGQSPVLNLLLIAAISVALLILRIENKKEREG